MISPELEKILKGQDYSLQEFPDDNFPLFMMLNIGRDKAAFATLDGHDQKNFIDAIEQLRKLYANHASEWANFELSLVLCQSADVTHDFRSRVEIDPYFCRKFIIDPKQIDSELRRLPFIPLSVLKQISERPLSAQTFLVQSGVSPELAKSIVIPHIRGDDKIIEDCINGNLGVPEKQAHVKESFVSSERQGESSRVRLKHLEISGFRAYSKKIEFDLDADVVVLFGPNGFGKTSFFDAVDFICTGSVARFDERFGRDARRLENSLKNLSSPTQDCYVIANLSVDDKELTIRRNLIDRTYSTAGGEPEQRKHTLLRLAGLPDRSTDIRIDNLVRLFRATHLFGQEYQSLTCDFRNESTLSEDVVSRMLALQDYVQALDKTSLIEANLNKQIKEKEKQIDLFSSESVLKRNQLDELKELKKSVDQPEVVANMVTVMAERLVRLGIKINGSPFDGNVIRGWRSIVNAEIGSLTHTVTIIEEILKNYSEYQMCRQKLPETLVNLKQINISLDEVNKKIDAAKIKLTLINASVDKILANGSAILSEKDALDWFKNIRPKYMATIEEMNKQSVIHNDTNIKLIALLHRETLLNSQQEQLTSEIEDKKLLISSFYRNLEDLKQLSSEIAQWRAYAEQEKATISDMRLLDDGLLSLEDEAHMKQQSFMIVEKQCNELSSSLMGMQEMQSDLRQILQKLEQYITDNVCPTCGAVYQSREELLDRLRRHRSNEPVEITRLNQSRDESKLELVRIQASLQETQKKIRSLKQKRNETTELLNCSRDKLLQFQQRLLILGVKATPYNAENIINSESERIAKSILDQQLDLNILQDRAMSLKSEIGELKKEKNNLVASIQEFRARLESLKKMEIIINEEAFNQKVSLSLTEEIANKRLNDMQLLIEQNNKDLEQTKIEINQTHKELNQLDAERLNLQNETDRLSTLKDGQNTIINKVLKLIAEVGVGDVNESKIFHEMGTRLNQQISEFNKLLNDLTNLETAMNSAEMSVSTARISKENADLEQIIQSAKLSLEKLDIWSNYFQNMRQELEHVRSQALVKYIESYGPLSSFIQKRLRAVYGFGDVKLRVHKGTIVAEVESSGLSGLPPSDYFSESQIQITMLGLFLSANLTQNWSHFCPVLLDDPVEHFDDLNSYSLVGLIKRLASQGRHGRQFIISTCDERLYRTMRQQFNNMEGKVAYHKFTALGENGPIVQHLSE